MKLVEFFNEKNRFNSLKNKYEALCSEKDMHFELVGKDSKNNDIFYCKKTIGSDKPNVAILSGLHGNEPGGPYGVIDFLKNYDSFDVCNLFIMPIMNPHGFNRHIRRDANQSDLNRQWDENNTKLIKTLKKLFKKQKFDFVLSLHEDDSADGFYIYGGRLIGIDSLKWIAEILATHIKPISDGEIYGDPVYGGVVEANDEKKPKHFKSLEFFFDKINVPNLTLELPGDLKLEKRIETYSEFLRKFMDLL